MMTSLLLGATLAAPGAPVPTSADPVPAGPAPWVMYLKADENQRPQVMIYKTQKVTQTRYVNEVVNGQNVQKQIQEQVERVVQSYVLLDTMNPTLTTAGGMKLKMDDMMKRAKTGVVLLISADGKPVSKSWLRAIDSEAIVVVADGLVSEAAPRSIYGVPTAAPRLALLGTDMKGKTTVAYNPSATTNNGAYYGGRGGRMIMANGQQMFFDEGMGYYSPYQTPQAGEAPLKPLEEIAFESYDLKGKAMSKAEAMKRLAAGGYALIAGDNRLPDESYLQQFRGDLVVLVSAELINVPTGKPKPGGTATAPAPAVRPVPAIVKPAIIQAAPALRIAPALKVAPAPAPAQKEEAPAPAAKPAPAKAVPAPVVEKAVPAIPAPEKK